jgi:hypothetical protein
MMTIGDDNYFINTHAESGAAQQQLVFGDIIHFTKGHLQAFRNSKNSRRPRLFGPARCLPPSEPPRPARLSAWVPPGAPQHARPREQCSITH